ncbi:MAG: NDP-sugar synthase [Methanomassiliicoccales archaeon]
MKSVILAGGEGTRLRPLTEKIPKPLIPVAGKPCVEYTILSLVKGGLRDMVITTGYLSDRLIRSIGDGSELGAHILYSFESSPAGTAGAVKLIHSFLESPFVVMSGDTLMDIDVKSMYLDHQQSGADVTMAVTSVEDTGEFGVVATDDDGFVARFQEKPKKEEAFSNLINAGAYVMDGGVMQFVPEGQQFDFARQLFPLLLKKGYKIRAHRLDGTWLDIGRPADLQRANAVLVEKYGQLNEVRGCSVSGKLMLKAVPACGNDVEIRGPSFIGRNVVLDDRTTVERSSLYDEVQVGAETRVVDSLILEGCRIGRRCDLKGSILSPGCRIGDNVLIERSVLGEGVSVKSNSSLIGAHISPLTV